MLKTRENLNFVYEDRQTKAGSWERNKTPTMQRNVDYDVTSTCYGPRNKYLDRDFCLDSAH